MDLSFIRTKMGARQALPSPSVCRALREGAGLSQEDVATAVGVHRETVSRWERGERAPRGTHLVGYVSLLTELRTAAK
jgi:DNA-binding transcriptional regulator YiaG